VGCDGRQSTVRRIAGVGWHGRRYDEKVVLAGVEHDADLATDAAHVVVGQRGVVLVFALGERATWRLLATRPAGRDRLPFGQPGRRSDLPTSRPCSTIPVSARVSPPAALDANVRSASWSVMVTGLKGAVRLESASGPLRLRDLQGPTVVSTASGEVQLANITGDVQVASVSGGIYGMGVTRVTDARSTSGGIDLLGDFATDARIAIVGGSVTLRFTPQSSVHVDAASTSGSIDADDLALSVRQTGTHSLSGNLGAGLSTLTVRTTSDNIKFLNVQ
jgi:Putative adhesin